MTAKEKQQFNLMYDILRRISKEYMTPDKLRKNSEKMYGLEYEECIEMVYENIQADAAAAIKGVKPIKDEVKQELTNL